MSNNSSQSMPWFRGDDFLRVFTPTQSEDSGYCTYQDSQTNCSLSPDASPDIFSADETRINSPSTRPPSSLVIDFSQCGQRCVFSPMSPLVRRDPPIEYSEMTQSEDSDRESQSNRWLSQDASPDMFSPTTQRPYALNLIDALEFSPSSPRQSQIDEWLRSTPLSPSLLEIVPESDLLIFGRILYTSQNETSWAEDGYNDILAYHMLANEDKWYNDGADEVLNLHMDAFEDLEGEN